MTDTPVRINGVRPGAGTCAACGARAPRGALMCRGDWRKVPQQLQRDVYRALDAYGAGDSTLGELRETQIAAVSAARAAG